MNESTQPSDSPPPPRRPSRAWRFAVRISVILCLGFAAIYYYAISGGFRARRTPSAFEAFVAQGLVDLSVPRDAKALKSPLADGTNDSDLATGREIYQRNCETCHGYDGKGRTGAG